MATLCNDPAQLTLPLPTAPDTAPVRATTEERLFAIRNRALPKAEAEVAFLQCVWESPERGAVPIFINGDSPFLCHPAGVDRLSAAAAYASALTVEAAALAALQRAVEVYEVGGPLVIGGDAAPSPERQTARRPSARSGFPDLRSRTEFVWRLRQYVGVVERELQSAVTGRKAEIAAGLEAELAALHARLHEVAGVVRRRPRKASEVNPAHQKARRIA